MFFRKFFRPFPALCFLTLVPVVASGDDLSGPVLGLVADARAGAVRPIRGVPGAASIGDPLDLGGSVTGIAVTPRQSSAVLITNSGIRVESLAADGTVSNADAGLPAGFHPTVVRFSPTGMTAALYDPAASQLWLKAGTADTARQLDISQLPARIDRMAVSDRADTPIAGTFEGDGQSIFAMDGQGGLHRIGGFTGVTDLTFLGSSGDLAVADGGAKQVLSVRGPLSGNGPDLLLEVAGAPNVPFRIASSGDGTQVAVLAALKANKRITDRPVGTGPSISRQSGNPVLGLLRLADRQWSPVECGCAPVDLVPLKGNAVYRLTDRIDEPVWILDGDSGTARVVFVPAVQK
jgi:hypothetical protein